MGTTYRIPDPNTSFLSGFLAWGRLREYRLILCVYVCVHVLYSQSLQKHAFFTSSPGYKPPAPLFLWFSRGDLQCRWPGSFESCSGSHSPQPLLFFTLLYTSHPPHPTQVLFLLAGPPRVAGALVDISSSLREESGKGEGNLPRLRYSELGESHWDNMQNSPLSKWIFNCLIQVCWDIRYRNCPD